jgi:hypothetical protein
VGKHYKNVLETARQRKKGKKNVLFVKNSCHTHIDIYPEKEDEGNLPKKKEKIETAECIIFIRNVMYIKLSRTNVPSMSCYSRIM